MAYTPFPAFPMTTGIQASPVSNMLPQIGAMTDINVSQGPAINSGGWLDSLKGFGGTLKDYGVTGSTNANGVRTEGWGGLALGLGQSLFNGIMAMKQYGIAKDAQAAARDEFSKNFEAQRTMVNSQLEDRQRARVASNPGAYQSVSDYMKRNGI